LSPQNIAGLEVEGQPHCSNHAAKRPSALPEFNAHLSLEELPGHSRQRDYIFWVMEACNYFLGVDSVWFRTLLAFSAGPSVCGFAQRKKTATLPI
jgi:hypothetical protein